MKIKFCGNVLIYKENGAKRLCQNLYIEPQPDGRIRHWVFISEIGKYLRVVTLEDGETIHNAFPDRNFKEFTK